MANKIHDEESTLVYGSDQELNSGLSSEKVQGMANSVYSEFKRMMTIYGEDSIKELMPLIVTILEALDRSLTECNENAVEIEMLRDDNEQLATQFDRERQLRRSAEQQLMASEDHNEAMARELRSKADGLETTARHLELKCKNYTDQIERLQERESEIKKEYTVLHERHTEMIQSYMEHIERTKILQQQQSYTELSQSPHNKKDLQSVGTTPSPGDSQSVKAFSSDSNKNQETSDIGQSVAQSTPSDIAYLTPGNFKEESSKHPATTPGFDEEANVNFLASEIANKHLKVKRQIQSHLKKEQSRINDSKQVQNRNVSQAQADSDNVQVENEATSPLKEESARQDWVSAEVKEMLEKADLDMDDENREGGETGFIESSGIENAAFDQTQTANVNESSLFAELTEQDINDVDEGADILGMSKEVENLINENAQLMATKNALNVVKDDLIQRVDQLTTHQTLLKEEMKINEKAKSDLQEKVKDFEKQVIRLKQELSNVASGVNSENSVARKTEEDDGLPLSQRKRFTRVEMARVLMERNQYKERLMELQEAVRWTETLRASRAQADTSSVKTKSKSTIFQFFSRLFTSSNNEPGASEPLPVRPPPRRSLGGGDVGLNVGFSASSAKVVPRSRSAQFSLYGRSPTIDALREEKERWTVPSASELEATSLKARPHTKPEPIKREVQPKMADSRLQACGWSLPNTPGTPKEGSRTVPVPVFCAPIFSDDPDMKLLCAAAINLIGDGTSDGVVSTVFHNSPNLKRSAEQRRDNKALSDVDKLNEELKEESSKLDAIERKQNNLSSFVWLVAGSSRAGKSSGGNVVRIMNACEPNSYLDQFNVGSNDTNILCIANIPGADSDDFLMNSFRKREMSKQAVSSDGSSESSVSGEFATEATEDLVAPSPSKKVQTKGVTEHVFTDSDPIQPPTSNNVSSGSMEIGSVEKIRSPTLPISDKSKADNLEACESTRLASLQPTVWFGAQNGYVYVYSAISNWRKCLHQLRLKDSILAIVHLKGNVLAGLADGTVAFFRRHDDGVWNLSNYHLLDLGRPHHSVRCLAVVYDHVWCAYRNKIHIVEPTSMKIRTSFDAHPRSESQVRQLAWVGDGVWVSIRLDSTVRLYHARTLQHLQDVDVEPYVSKVLGSGKLGFSFVRITALTVSHHRLWIGTGNGVVMSVPLSEARPQSDRASTLQRFKTCMKYQDVLAGCGLSAIKCLVCSQTVSVGKLPMASSHHCTCASLRGSASRRDKRVKMSKRAGTLLREKLLQRKGSKSNTSAPVLSSSARDRPGGVIRVYSDPVSDKVTPGTFIPYCSMANAQLSFHGFRDSVKFFVAVPGCVTTSQASSNYVTLSPNKFPRGGGQEGTLVISGGGGYVDFRKGDLGAMTPEEKRVEAVKAAQGTLQKSHVIVWQLTHS